MSVTVVATVVPQPAQREAVLADLVAAIPAVHAEDGCEIYSLNEGEDRLVMIEKWASPEALQAHMDGEPIKHVLGAVDGRIEGEVDIQVFTPHPVGGAKGAV